MQIKFKPKLAGIDPVSKKETFNFLVVSALQEELNEFYLANCMNDPEPMDDTDAKRVTCNFKDKSFNVLTYTPNKMGMPFNAAAIMNIITTYQPDYTFFIGTCAGLKSSNRSLGDVLIPHRIFSYESGKYENGKFLPDYMSYETGNYLRKQAEYLKSKIGNELSYRVITDEDFCSGGAVIDDKEKREEILKQSARKVSGLDMEAYSLACINSILIHEGKEAIVIKGIMDFAMDKSDSEEMGNKMSAKVNAADFAFRLIKYLDNEIRKSNSNIKLKNHRNLDEEIKIEDTINNLIIHSAIYGADGDLRDVLHKIKELISQNIVKIPVNNWLVAGPEPAVGKEKTLALIYTINGKKSAKTIYERSILDVSEL